MSKISNDLDRSIVEILNDVSDLVVLTTWDGIILFSNSSWLKTIGPTESGTPLSNYIHSESRKDWKVLQNPQTPENIQNGHTILTTVDGRKIPSKVTLKRLARPVLHTGVFQVIFHIDIGHQNGTMESEQLYSTLVEHANDGIYYARPCGHIVYMNGPGANLLGCDIDEVAGSHFSTFVSAEHRDEVNHFYQKQFDEKLESTYLEFSVQKPDGSELWVGQNVRTIFNRDQNGWIEGYIGIFRDVSSKRMQELELLEGNKLLEEYIFKRTKELEASNARLLKEVNRRKKTEERLQKKQKEYELLFQNVHDAVIIFNPKDEKVLEANARACELYGFTREELIGTSLEDRSGEIKAGKTFIRKTLKSKSKMTFVTTQMNKDGDHILVEVNASAIKYRGKKAIISINRDITSKVRLDEQLEKERRQRLSALIDGQEMERKRIARELHDGIGQMLSSLVRLIKKLQSEGALNTTQYLGLYEAKQLTDHIIEESRRISKNLMPHVLSDFGLGPAIQSMVEIATKGDINISLHFGRQIPRVDPKTEIGVYRIIQEAVTNAIRHAKASNIRIEIDVEPGKLKINVIDNGIGFDISDTTILYHGNGLTNMMERAELLGMLFEIKSEKKKGTRILMNLDYDEQD